jgi:hypothetical protein
VPSPTKRGKAEAELVAGILENYANRGVFKGFSHGPSGAGKAVFRMLWHRDRFFELILDTHKKTLRFPVVLPEIPARSSMYREFKEFIESRHSADLPEHRRINPKKATVKPSIRAGNAGLTLTVRNGDYAYATRKLINLVHEVFLDFLYDGRYYDYLVETFDLDPDHL